MFLNSRCCPTPHGTLVFKEDVGIRAVEPMWRTTRTRMFALFNQHG